MSKILKYIRPFVLCTAATVIISCADDIGNYTYKDKQIITIEGIPEDESLLSGSDYIDYQPVVTSSIDGNIDDTSTKYSFLYQRKDSEGNWIDVASTKDIHVLAALSSGKHYFRFCVTDNETGVTGIKLFRIQSTTVTSEGWIVLCNEGADERVRVDMLSQISLDRIVPTHDVILTESDVPAMYHATNLGFYSCNTSNRNKIVAMSETGAYLLPTADDYGYTEFVTMRLVDELKTTLFVSSPDDHIVTFTSVPCSVRGKGEHDAVICISKEGNAFAWNTVVQYSGFENPINTSTRGEDPEYRVAPYVGASLKRPSSAKYGTALLYDIDNHRFIGWHGTDDNTKQTCYPLDDPDESTKKFSFKTGTMDLVCMINTAFSEGVTYCIMQDGSQRHIYAINVNNDDFVQEGCYKNITATNFNNASVFAASSQYSVIYYAYKNKVYAYNYATQTCEEAITLDSNEEVTMLTLNRMDHPWGVDFLCRYNEEKTAIYQARENRLIVGSYDNSVSDDNGGILRFYDVASPGTKLSLYPGWEYKGYAKIKDVKYKEVR